MSLTLNTMSGPAVREDGTLRDASELEWCHSASPTPNLSPLATPNLLPLATPDLCKKKSPMKSKEKKRKNFSSRLSNHLSYQQQQPEGCI